MDFSHVLEFFLARKKVDGGFGASPRLPATIEDTYYALRSLVALRHNGYHVPQSALAGHGKFLIKKLLEHDRSPRSSYQLFWCLRALDIERPQGDKEAFRVRAGQYNLEDLFYIRRMGAGCVEPSYFIELQKGVRTVRDLRMFLYLFRENISSGQRSRWIDWILRCQNPDGGLGFMPGTTSFLENCYYGIRVIRLLGDFPLDKRALYTFVLSTRSGKGGFGRRNMGVPFPSSTWHGVGTLLALEQIEKRK